jgi:hypothetical protein
VGAHAGEAAVSADASLLYGDIANLLSGAIVLGSACADPGDQVGGPVHAGLDAAVSSLPEAQRQLVPGTRCDGNGFGTGAGAPVPLSPCLWLPLVAGLVLGTGADVGRALGPAEGPVREALSEAEGGVATVNQTASQLLDPNLWCKWIDAPAEARNPQPALDAMRAGTDASEQAGAAFPAYDALRARTGSYVDQAMDADGLVQNPPGL